MLVLSRQRDETIMIGDDVEITVVDIRGDKVRLGIEAPARIAVHRKEVYEAIRAENEKASRVTGDEIDDLAQRLRVIRPDGAAPASPAGTTGAPVTPVRASPPGTGKSAHADGRRRA
ncbi:MAG: hypothetical protein Tsb0013_01210 [Phycisphaerales bacterium]